MTRIQLRTLAALLLCGVFLLPGLFWGLPNREGWEPDAIAPVGPLSAATTVFSGGFAQRYPPFHYYLSALAYAPYLGTLTLIGELPLPPPKDYPYGLRSPERSFSILIRISRALTIVMALGALWLLHRITRRLAGPTGAFFALLLLGLNPLFVAYGQTGNLDIPYLFWSLAALDALTALPLDPRRGTFARAGICAALATCTKDQAYGIFLLPFAGLCALAVFPRLAARTGLGIAARPLRAGAACLVAGFVVAFVLANNLVFNFSGFLEHVRIILGPASDPYRKYGHSPSEQLALFSDVARRAARTIGLHTLALAAAGFVFALRAGPKRWAAAVLGVAAGSYYATFIAPIGYSYERFLMPFVAVTAVFAGAAIDFAWAAIATRKAPLKAAGVALAAAILVWCTLGAVSVGQLFVQDTRYEAERLFAGLPLQARVVVHSIGERGVYAPRLAQPTTCIQYRSQEALDGTGDAPADYLVLIQTGANPSLEQANIAHFDRRPDYRPLAVFVPKPLLPVTHVAHFASPTVRVYERRR